MGLTIMPWVQAADVYAFGVLLWELYHGVRAWDGFNHAQVRVTPACPFARQMHCRSDLQR